MTDHNYCGVTTNFRWILILKLITHEAVSTPAVTVFNFPRLLFIFKLCYPNGYIHMGKITPLI